MLTAVVKAGSEAVIVAVAYNVRLGKFIAIGF
jgi:hypothetical protein